MATLADVQNAYRSIYRVPLDPAVAAVIVEDIGQNRTTLADYTAGLIQGAATTSGAAVAMFSLVMGVAPTFQHLDALKSAADAQLAYYQSLGVANPGLGPFEALGKGLAADPSTGFAARYASMSKGDFLDTVYAQAYGTAPLADARANLQGQIAYFVALYLGAGMSADDAAIQARGAVFGQIVGYGF